jgi:hypothetical protein
LKEVRGSTPHPAETWTNVVMTLNRQPSLKSAVHEILYDKGEWERLLSSVFMGAVDKRIAEVKSTLGNCLRSQHMQKVWSQT